MQRYIACKQPRFSDRFAGHRRDRVVRDQLAGSEDIVPTPLVPGIAYEVDVLDGATLPLWANEFDDGRSPAASNEWVEPDDIASALAEQSDELRRRRY